MTWLTANWPQVIELALYHLMLSVPAILASVLIAVPAGRLAYRRPGIGGPLLSAASLLYAVPALPLLIIIPAVLGIPLRSAATMIIALTVYGVALLVRTAADAFTSVSPHVQDAAIAIGSSPHSVFWRVDLPLAVPVLLSGVRVTTVSTIGLVTIGALMLVPLMRIHSYSLPMNVDVAAIGILSVENEFNAEQISCPGAEISGFLTSSILGP